MKKVIAMVTVLLMLVSLSSAVFADDTASKELQQVLVEVKEKVDIPDLLSEFEGNVQTSNKRTIYNFSWSDEKYEKSISVKADAEGRIIGYSDYSKEITQKKLTGFSKEEIKLFADTFLKATLPEIYTDESDLPVYDDESYNAGNGQRYSFSYIRRKNSVAVKNNRIDITVCVAEDNSLYIRNMSSYIDYDAEFTERKGEIPDVVQKYKETYPIELVYRNKYNSEWKTNGKPTCVPQLIYRIKDNAPGYISVETGEIVKEDTDDNVFRNEASMDSAGSGAQKSEALTEKELAEITAVQGLLSVSEIEKKVKALDYIKFPSNVKLTNNSLFKDENDKYIYNLYYTNNDNKTYSYVSMSVYADSGKLISFSCNDGSVIRKDINLTEQQKKLADNKITAFLSQAAPEEFKNTKLETSEDNNGYLTSYYHRVVNGVRHINNGIRVSLDAKNSVVTYFSLNFTDGEFDDPAKAVGEVKAYENLLKYSPVERMYVKTGGKYVECATLKLWGTYLDALTGEPDDKTKSGDYGFNYDDIDGHWVREAAVKLAEIQIGMKGDKLNPDSAVTEADYLRLIASGIYGKYYADYTDEELYNSLIREKILKESEKNPDSTITREDAFVYMIRMLNLEKVAKLENIFKIHYLDESQITSGKIGYCAILSGLGVISGDGGRVRPKDNLTRAEALIMLYRYMISM